MNSEFRMFSWSHLVIKIEFPFCSAEVTFKDMFSVMPQMLLWENFLRVSLELKLTLMHKT
jgi:hypothetical protein